MPKRNLIKIPPNLLDKLRAFDQDDVVVACAKFLRPEDVARYKHLGLRLDEGKLVVPEPSIPDPGAGRYSTANVYGLEKVRRDLPKEWKAYSFDAPNWGDWSNGSHEVTRNREVYRRDFYPPKEIELSVAILETRGDGFTVKFAIDQVLSRRTENFEQELLFNLNILQENVGAADVFPSAASLAEYTKTVRVDWQILPPGTVDEVVRAMLQGKRPVTPDQVATMKDRVTAMAKLEPEAYITGTDGFLRYFGAKFGDDCVVFENVKYGNAIYVMYDAWAELSRRSRIELLAGPRDSFDRIEHREGWKGQLTAMIKAYRESKKS